MWADATAVGKLKDTLSVCGSAGGLPPLPTGQGDCENKAALCVGSPSSAEAG